MTPISPKKMNCLSADTDALASVAQKLDHNLNFRAKTKNSETLDVGFTAGLKIVAPQ